MSISSVGSSSTQQYQPLSFASADTDQSNSLSLDEFSAIGQNLPGGNNGLDSGSIQKLFSAIDTDGDGQISKTEAKTAFDKLSTAMQGQLLGAQEQSGTNPADGAAAAPHKHHHGGGHAKPPSSDTAATDPLASLFGSADGSDDGAAASASGSGTSSGTGTDVTSLFAQAVSAYTDQPSTNDIVSKLLATLQTV